MQDHEMKEDVACDALICPKDTCHTLKGSCTSHASNVLFDQTRCKLCKRHKLETPLKINSITMEDGVNQRLESCRASEKENFKERFLPEAAEVAIHM